MHNNNASSNINASSDNNCNNCRNDQNNNNNNNKGKQNQAQIANSNGKRMHLWGSAQRLAIINKKYILKKKKPLQ